MEQPSKAAVRPFERQLQYLHPDLRVVWGEPEYGVERWVIQRRLPPDVHAACLAEFEEKFPGEPRFIDQQLTDDDDIVRRTRRFDRVAEWALIHVCENTEFQLEDGRGYRIPDEYELGIVHRWLNEFRNVHEQIRAVQAEREAKQAKDKQERIGHIARELKNNSDHLFGGGFTDAPRIIMPGTEI